MGRRRSTEPRVYRAITSAAAPIPTASAARSRALASRFGRVASYTSFAMPMTAPEVTAAGRASEFDQSVLWTRTYCVDNVQRALKTTCLALSRPSQRSLGAAVAGGGAYRRLKAMLAAVNESGTPAPGSAGRAIPVWEKRQNSKAIPTPPRTARRTAVPGERRGTITQKAVGRDAVVKLPP